MTGGAIEEERGALPFRRREDGRYLTGEALYAGDVRLPDMLHATVVRSEYAHARLLGMDLSVALAHTGVVDAFAAADIQPYNKQMPTRFPVSDALSAMVQRPLATEKVRYVGEPIAVVIAESRALGEDAADLVEVAYEPLDAVASVDAALAPGAPALFEGRSNVASSYEIVKGDVEDALRDADLVVTESFSVQRHTGSPLETRGLVVAPGDAPGAVSIWGVTKLTQHHRRVLADMLEVPEQSVQCLATDVGGGFGVRGEFYPEDLLIPVACFRVGRPVQWLEDRREHLLATNHSREMVWTVTAGLKSTGEIVAIDSTLTLDFGAYVRPLGDWLAAFAGQSLPGPYRIPVYRCKGKSVMTNKMGVGTMRSPGAFEATFARERLIDICAARLGMDRVEIRRRNLLRSDELPYATGTGVVEDVVYDSGNYHAVFDSLLDAIEPEYESIRPTASDPRRPVGLGLACVVEATGWGREETATVRYVPPDNYTVLTASTSLGQGHANVMARIAADALGVSPDRVSVVNADTRYVPPGEGTFASRTISMAGSAVLLASEKLAGLLSVDSSEPTEATVTYKFRQKSWPFAASAAIVEVDADLGTVRILKYVIAADIGRVMDPVLASGQIAGAAVIGIGGSLFEELRYAEDGQPMTTSFMDYLLPTSVDVPDVETILVDNGPSSSNPLGVRGAAEIGTPGAGAAIANAVAAALGDGKAITALPLTPDRLLV